MDEVRSGDIDAELRKRGYVPAEEEPPPPDGEEPVIDDTIIHIPRHEPLPGLEPLPEPEPTNGHEPLPEPEPLPDIEPINGHEPLPDITAEPDWKTTWLPAAVYAAMCMVVNEGDLIIPY